MIHRHISVFLAILLVGCATDPVAINVNYLSGKGVYPPEPLIAVLNTPPAGAYIPIARLVVTGAQGLTQPQALEALEKKAQELGANAVIVQNESQDTVPDVAYNPAGGEYAVTTPIVAPKLIGLAIHTEKSQDMGD